MVARIFAGVIPLPAPIHCQLYPTFRLKHLLIDSLALKSTLNMDNTTTHGLIPYQFDSKLQLAYRKWQPLVSSSIKLFENTLGQGVGINALPSFKNQDLDLVIKLTYQI